MSQTTKRAAADANTNEPVKKKRALLKNKENKTTKLAKISSGVGGGSKKFGIKNVTGNKQNNAKNMSSNEKQDWNKYKQEKKELKLKRKKSKTCYEITAEAKQIYEKLKCRRTENKAELVEKLYNLISKGDTIQKIIMAHDTTRILQCMLKYAAPGLRDEFAQKLLPHVVVMCQSKYSRFCVLRMLKYSSANIKTKLINYLFGHIVKLAGHNYSSKLLDYMYHSVASEQQKNYMRQEFYGELYRKTKDDNVKKLPDSFEHASNMKPSIMNAVKANLEHVANKQLMDNALVHAVMLEYLQACDEDKFEETVSAYVNSVPLMITTKEGSQAATICFYRSNNRNRRVIVKSIKEHLIKIATHEHGHVFLIAVINALDDTKATKKVIYDRMHNELETLAENQYGRRVIQWLVSPADTNCFHPTFISNIEQGLQYSKKQKDIRRREIFEQIEGPITEYIISKPEFWLANSNIGLVTAVILKRLSTNNFIKATEALIPIILQNDWMVTVETSNQISGAEKSGKKAKTTEEIIEEATKQRKLKQSIAKADFSQEKKKEADAEKITNAENNMSGNNSGSDSSKRVRGIDEAGMHIVLKKIIKNDQIRTGDEIDTFGSMLVKKQNADTLKYWLTVNRACFVLLNVVEQNKEMVTEQLKQLITEANLTETLKEQKTKGAELLTQKLSL